MSNLIRCEKCEKENTILIYKSGDVGYCERQFEEVDEITGEEIYTKEGMAGELEEIVFCTTCKTFTLHWVGLAHMDADWYDEQYHIIDMDDVLNYLSDGLFDDGGIKVYHQNLDEVYKLLNINPKAFRKQILLTALTPPIDYIYNQIDDSDIF